MDPPLIGAGSPGFRFSLELPWPPSVNKAWRPVVRTGRNGYAIPRMLTTDAMLIYRREVETAALEQRVPRRRLAVPVGLELLCSEPSPVRRRDLDNLLKAVQDALVHADVLEDDRWIDELHVRRLAPIPGAGFVRATLFSLGRAEHVRQTVR